VAGVDLAVPEGAIYGVLGPNGAGKTTVIRMLATLIAPDAGTARVLGHDIRTEGDAVRGLVSTVIIVVGVALGYRPDAGVPGAVGRSRWSSSSRSACRGSSACSACCSGPRTRS
jgi:ABC-type cobalamin/Fe3+-siderophores transport system ATPase subunit